MSKHSMRRGSARSESRFSSYASEASASAEPLRDAALEAAFFSASSSSFT
jgi:hypothetical protein